MALTNPQRTTLHNDILAIPALAPILIDSQSPIFGSFSLLMDWYNAASAPAFYVYRRDVPTDEIFDQVIWANMTPNTAPDNTQLWANRSLACQGKQFNLQTLLVGRATIDAAKASLRSGLQDALTDLPSGTGSNVRQAGWTQVTAILARVATRGEKLFANTNNGNGAAPGTAATARVEGDIALDDFIALRS